MMEDAMKEDLMEDPNPKQSFITESPESTVSFDSSSDRLAKKTRELPNLSDCHSCGVRINYTNPRDRLQPLDSLWRIVLLCKKCVKRVSCSDLCTYCFSDVVDINDCFKCRDCEHSVHKECVARFGSELGFSVCVDCWIPDAIAKSITARKMKFKRKNNVSCESDSFVEEMRREVVIGLKASNIAVEKAVVAKNAVELAKGVSSVVAGRKVVAGGEAKVVDDVELAFLLHRAINSSPRVSRYGCLVGSYRKDGAPIAFYSRRGVGKKCVLMNSSSLGVPLICYSRRQRKGFLKNSASLNNPLMRYSRRPSGSKAFTHDAECECFICKARKISDDHGSTSSAGLEASNSVNSSEDSLSGNDCQENDVGRIATKPPRNLLKYYRIGKGKPRPSFFVDSDCSCMDSTNLCTKGMPDTRNYGNRNECHEITENCDDNPNRFWLKYKRFSRCKARIQL